MRMERATHRMCAFVAMRAHASVHPSTHVSNDMCGRMRTERACAQHMQLGIRQTRACPVLTASIMTMAKQRDTHRE